MHSSGVKCVNNLSTLYAFGREHTLLIVLFEIELVNLRYTTARRSLFDGRSAESFEQYVGTEDKFLTKINQPLHEAAEDLLHRDEIKHLLH